jgi:thiamine-phosphate pyrophosphorylase
MASQAAGMFLYYITDRKQLSTDPENSIQLLLERIRQAAEAGITAIQLREKDLAARELLSLARRAMAAVNEANTARVPALSTRLLINSRVDVAAACGCQGVHLRSDDMSAADARAILLEAGVERPFIGVSCHSLTETELAAGHGSDFVVFGPVFGKGQNGQPTGTNALSEACASVARGNYRVPVLALGGISLNNAAACLEAGAAGIAGIRLFQNGNIIETLSRLRAIGTSVSTDKS